VSLFHTSPVTDLRINVAPITGTLTQARLNYTYTNPQGAVETKAWRVELKQGGIAQDLTSHMDRINALAQKMMIDNRDSQLSKALIESHKANQEFRIAPKSENLNGNKTKGWIAQIVEPSSLRSIPIPDNLLQICNKFFPLIKDTGGIDPVQKTDSIGFLKRISAWLFGSNARVEVPQSLGSSTPIKIKYTQLPDGGKLEHSTYECDLMGYMQMPQRNADQAKRLIETIQDSKEDLDLDNITYENDTTYGKSVQTNFNTDIPRSEPIKVIETSVKPREVRQVCDTFWFSDMLKKWFPCEKTGYETVQDRNQKRLNHWLCMHMLTQGALGLVADDLKKARGCKEGEELKVTVIERNIEKTESGSIKIHSKLEVEVILPAGDDDTRFKLKENSKYPAEWSVTFPSPTEQPQLSIRVTKPSLRTTHPTLGAGFGR